MRGWTIAIPCLALVACSVSADVTRALGARCTEKSDCDERCLSSDDYPDGFCTLNCADDDDCPDGASCADDEGGVCLFGCEEDRDCTYLGEGWACVVRDATVVGEVKVCRG